MRLFYFATKREHAIPLFVDAKILPVDLLYYLTIILWACVGYEVVNSQRNRPAKYPLFRLFLSWLAILNWQRNLAGNLMLAKACWDLWPIFRSGWKNLILPAGVTNCHLQSVATQTTGCHAAYSCLLISEIFSLFRV